MAKISGRTIPEKALCIFTIEGSASRDELLSVVSSIKPEETTKNIIWDATKGTVETIGTEDIQKIARFLKAGHGMREGGKTGLVGPEDLDYGIGRMFQAYASLEHLSVEYRLFRTLEQAMVWIESGDN